MECWRRRECCTILVDNLNKMLGVASKLDGADRRSDGAPWSDCAGEVTSDSRMAGVDRLSWAF